MLNNDGKGTIKTAKTLVANRIRCKDRFKALTQPNLAEMSNNLVVQCAQDNAWTFENTNWNFDQLSCKGDTICANLEYF